MWWLREWRVLCLVGLHDWDYFSLMTFGGDKREDYRCCMRCEKSELVGWERIR